MRKFYSIGLGLLLITHLLSSQQLTQTVRGKVIDMDTRTPLIGVNLIITGTDPLVGTVTDMNGEFKFKPLAVGRHDLQIQYLGYEPKVIPNILVNAGKEIVLNVELIESVQLLEGIVVQAKKHKSESLNKLASVSARSFTVEETQRFAGSINDPARMVTGYAGVSMVSDETNEIIVRGNSPRGMLWRIDGIDVPNPNHYAEEGATGGAISILNSTTLDNSDFFTGAFPAEYGNAYSGIFDIKLRDGNNENREYTVQAGLLGAGVSAEGPFLNGNKPSYLFNYRYSTLAIMNKIGIKIVGDAVPEFQDMVFKIKYPTKRFGTFSFFGVGGMSNIYEEEIRNYKNDFGTDMGVLGLTNNYIINDKTYIRSTLSLSVTRNIWAYQNYDEADFYRTEAREEFLYKTFRGSVEFNRKLNSRNKIVVGLKANSLGFDLFSDYYDDDYGRLIEDVTESGQTELYQGYVNWKFRPVESLTFNSGLHFMYFNLTGKEAIEPRFGVKWQIDSKRSLSAGFGVHSKIDALTNYVAKDTLSDGTEIQHNRNLDFTKARHYIVGFENRFSHDLYIKVELYFQDLYNVPVEDDTASSLAAINFSDGYTNVKLSNDGKGINYGVDLTFEKFFSSNYYFLITGSLYKSTFTAKDGISRNSRYDGSYVGNIIGGKEWKVGKAGKGNTIGFNIRGTWAGGQKYTPIDVEESRIEGYTVRDEKNVFTAKRPDFIRFDAKLSYRRNKKKSTRIWEIDIQNVTNNLNVVGDYWDSDANNGLGAVETYTQMGLIPVLNYRIEF